MTSDFKYRELNGQRRKAEQKFRVPKDVNKVEAWAKEHDYPAPKPGEEPWQYLQRMEPYIDQRRAQDMNLTERNARLRKGINRPMVTPQNHAFAPDAIKENTRFESYQ